ncbi:MAG: hypothetical protein EAZ43_01870 [Betaproteobacteria bacterium]|nr:MAG: hypothetical protein EAZ43_01870 [Betaproteobacteria bacterium]
MKLGAPNGALRQVAVRLKASAEVPGDDAAVQVNDDVLAGERVSVAAIESFDALATRFCAAGH